jgi:hypothetical protein
MYYLPAIAAIFAKTENPSFHQTVQSNEKASFGYNATLIAFIVLNFILGIYSAPILEAIEKGLRVFA